MKASKLLICTLVSFTQAFAEKSKEIDQDLNSKQFVKNWVSSPKPSSFERLKVKTLQEQPHDWNSKTIVYLIMDLIHQNKPDVCVDIGAFSGGITLPMARALKFLNHGTVYAIDAYSNEVALKGVLPVDSNYNWWSKLDLKATRKSLEKSVNALNLNKHVKLLVMTSEEAAKEISVIDFLHIDGALTEEVTTQDVDLYLPKVKSGGYILVSKPFLMINKDLSRMSAVFKLFDYCDLVYQEQEDFALFKKN